MRRLMILAFTFVAFHDVNCETSQTTAKPIKGNVVTTYHPQRFYISNPAAVHQHQAKDLFYYNKDLLTANQGQVPSLSSKQTPSTVVYREDSSQGPVLNYPTAHYQTIVPQRSVPDYNIQTVAGTSHTPLTTNGQGFLILSPVNQNAGYYQPTNQYSVAQPFVESSIRQPQVSTGPVQFYNAPAYSHFHLPVQQQQPQFYPTTSYQQLTQNSNQQITQQTIPAPKIQPVQTPKQTPPASPQKTDFQFKTPPLFQHHVYHPLYTSVKQQPQQKIIHRPYKPNPPTPPRIYKVFTPMIPSTPRRVIPVSERPVPPQQTHNRQANKEEENEDKGEVNEEEEDDDERENEKIEEEDEDDHSDVKQEEHDDEDDFRPPFGFSGKYHHHDDDDEDNDNDDRPHSRYRQHDDDDDDHDSADTKKYTKNVKPKAKLPAKHKYPKNFAADVDYTSHFNPSFYEHKGRPGPDFQQPKVEVKMYKYTRSSNEPQKTEYIEGNGSELKPVIQHNQKTYQSKWIISTKTSSKTDE